jgi:hypothetical protein
MKVSTLESSSGTLGQLQQNLSGLAPLVAGNPMGLGLVRTCHFMANHAARRGSADCPDGASTSDRAAGNSAERRTTGCTHLLPVHVAARR